MTTNGAIIKGRTANEVYPAAVAAVMGGGKTVPSRVAPTLEIHPATLVIEDPSKPIVTSFGRPVNVTFAMAEVLWILGGMNQVEMLEHYNSHISDYSDDGETFNAAYGFRLRHAHGHDQIEDVIRLLTEDPESRQAVLNITLPSKDRAFEPMRVPSDTENFAFEEVKRVTKDRACNLMAHLMIRDGVLDWMQVLRSNDVIHGTPYNFIQWMSMQRYIAGRLGVKVGTYTHIADSLHAYEYHHAEATEITEYDLYQDLNDEWGFYQHYPLNPENTSPETLAQVLAYEYTFRNSEWNKIQIILDNVSRDDIPIAWMGMLELFAAHSLYKHGYDALAAEILFNCTDSVMGIAQARFYYYQRWFGPGYEDVNAVFDQQHPVHHYMLPENTLYWMRCSNRTLTANNP